MSGCSPVDTPRVSAADVTQVELADVPAAVKAVVMDARSDFDMQEVQKKVRDGRIYYDVEGKLPDGSEIEFDVLMTEAGPQIVEVQRDLDWAVVPADARALVDAANKDGLRIARIIESVQTDSSIIYEVFVSDHPSDPRYEVQIQNGQAKLLKERWEH